MAHAVTNRGQIARRHRPAQDQGRPLRLQTRTSPSLRADARQGPTAGRLRGKAALIVGGDGGIARAVAIAFAREGADIAILYLNEHRAAENTRQTILQANVRCILVAGDVTREGSCRSAVKRVIAAFGRLDILVNNAAEQRPHVDHREIAHVQRVPTARTNLFGMFSLTKAALPHLPAGGAIINTTAVTAWHDSAHLIDDPETTGTIVSFTRSVAQALGARRIRVNAVTPGPAATPMIGARLPSGSRRGDTPVFGAIAPTYVFLAGGDGSFMTGQVLRAEAAEPVASVDATTAGTGAGPACFYGDTSNIS
jgi:NAD(P)-dependent dehydrogenase (short-subunit alcohol dehydrogenase family)